MRTHYFTTNTHAKIMPETGHGWKKLFLSIFLRTDPTTDWWTNSESMPGICRRPCAAVAGSRRRRWKRQLPTLDRPFHCTCAPCRNSWIPLRRHPIIIPVIIIIVNNNNTSQSKPWALWIRQLVNSLPIWRERSPQPQAMRGKELFCSAESFGAGATLQRCLVTWHLASHWLHGMMICTKFCTIFIFKLPRGEHNKNNNNIKY